MGDAWRARVGCMYDCGWSPVTMDNSVMSSNTRDVVLHSARAKWGESVPVPPSRMIQLINLSTCLARSDKSQTKCDDGFFYTLCSL